MDEKLSVFWGKDLVGTLRRMPEPRQLTFRYDGGWLASGGPPVSLSLPLSEADQEPLATTNFFGNYIPEGYAYVALTLLRHIPHGDTFRFLSRYGRECAGALSVLPYGDPVMESPADYRDVTDELTRQLSLPPERRANLTAVTGAKISLAGAQNKLAAVLEGERILVPADASFASTTHIIKSPAGGFADLQYNEAFCMELARAVDLPVAKSDIVNIGGSDVLVVERYDRTVLGSTVYRLHQEDFCQATGISSVNKYEEFGGPGFSACAGLIEGCIGKNRSADDFAKLAVFNFIIGNCDAHAKNFSLLYERVPELDLQGTGMRLAPFYDLLSTLAYTDLGIDTSMAMRYGDIHTHEAIGSSSFAALASDLGMEISRFTGLARETTAAVAEAASEIADKHGRRFPETGIYGKLQAIIENGTASANMALDGLGEIPKPNPVKPRPSESEPRR
ncbi:MAG: HipA domain-containing protein [Deltaproteobacteria bacterium]|jgi:serine/threonine-protein kinase HipA|nr:HipA domain-containing protein [Deltaproteobacteria bacterium]